MGIPERLVAVREKFGYTRKRLADELERPYRTITKYETGEREPGHSYIVEIAKKFGVSTDYLLGASDLMFPNAKKSPSAAEAAPGEQGITLERSNQLLIGLGLIEEGQDLSDDDLSFIGHVVGLLDAWFGNQG